MKVVIGEAGLNNTWQKPFPATTKCVHCDGTSRIGFVAHELEPDEEGPHVWSLHPNEPEGEGYWLHDSCAVAVYFCKGCLNTTALYNQG